ncbi:MAG: LEA type 2 family protein [Pseudomonadales bacterium]|nr:LEA type 2 family protein [Pseudomonadales bacterium]
MTRPLHRYASILLILFLALTFEGCSTVLQEVIKAPEVSVGKFKLVKAGFINQTFSIQLNVNNPNKIPLPIKTFDYTVSLAGDEFAKGRIPKAFSIPAGGTESIDIIIKLNLLRSSSHLVNVIKSGTKAINYELNGNIGIDLPFMAAVPVKKVGQIKLSR